MYPILHGLERKGHLQSQSEKADGRERRVYRITPIGRRALETGRTKVRELFGELILEHEERRRVGRSSQRKATATIKKAVRKSAP